MFHTPKIWSQKFTHLIQCHKPTTSTNILQTLSRAWVNDNINFCQRAWILIKNWGCCKQLKKNCIRHSAMFAIQPWSTLLITWFACQARGEVRQSTDEALGERARHIDKRGQVSPTTHSPRLTSPRLVRHIYRINILPGVKCMHFVHYIKQRHILKLHGITNSTASCHQWHCVTHHLSNGIALWKGTVTKWHHVTNGCRIPIGWHVTKRHRITKRRCCQRVPHY